MGDGKSKGRLIDERLKAGRNTRRRHLIVPAFQKSLGVDRSHAAGARRGDRLAVDVILHIAASKHAGNIGLGAVVGENVAARI